MPHFKALTDAYISAEELKGKTPTLTIVKVRSERMAGEDGKEKSKGIVTFGETPREWVLSKTAIQQLGALLGEDYGKWPGHRITLTTEPTPTGDGIRVLGSPDLHEPVTCVVKLSTKGGGKKKKQYTLIPTGRGQAAQPEEPAAPATDREPGEGG